MIRILKPPREKTAYGFLYTQIPQEQRYDIYACMKPGFSKTAIATEIGVHTSTRKREMTRNRGKKGSRSTQRRITISCHPERFEP